MGERHLAKGLTLLTLELQVATVQTDVHQLINLNIAPRASALFNFWTVLLLLALFFEVSDLLEEFSDGDLLL